MIKIPVHNTFTTPSQQLTTYLSILEVMAAYAKAAHQTDLFNQLKEQHDKMVTQYNEQNKPKKKGFWEQVKDNLTLNMDTHTRFYLSLLEEEVAFTSTYDSIKNLPQSKLLQELKKGIDQLNNLRL
jgi:hypothetical protein